MTGYQIDLDTKHSVIRLTVKEETVTEELAEDMYRHLMEVTAKGGPYAAIYDLTTTKHTTIDTNAVRSWGRHHRPAVPQGVCPFCGHPRKHVVVGVEPHIYGLARVFEMCTDAIGSSFEVVRTLTEAYEIVEDSPENFNECVLVEELA
jgi:hypothetical protein